ncbi:MAG TPA: hypothetical protein VLX85_10525 [Stellaceae bacterium]|nr:hypothetical protein [Stellaceae bacterium]
MTHSVALNDNLGVIVLRYRGSVDFSEIRFAFDELVQTPGFREGLKLVADFRESETPLSGAQVRNLADHASLTDARWGSTKWAIVASNDVTYGLARMYQTLTSDYRVVTRVFRNTAEADDWLGLGVPLTELLV